MSVQSQIGTPVSRARQLARLTFFVAWTILLTGYGYGFNANDRVRCTDSDVNVRTGAGTSYSSIGKLNTGDLGTVQNNSVSSGSGFNWQYIKWDKFSQAGYTALNYVAAAVVPTATSHAATNITSSSAQFNATINPNGLSTTAWFQYGPTTSYGSSSGSGSFGGGTSDIDILTTLTGAPADTNYHYRVVATNSVGTSYGSDKSFKTAGAPPTVDTKAATNVTSGSATLNASVNPNGGVTTAYFEFGLSTNYGATTSATSIGNGFSSVSVALDTGLIAPNATFHYRAVGSSSRGTIYGQDATFQTLAPKPTATSHDATSVTSTTAQFNGTINPNGSATTAWFEYGTATSYGSSSNPVSVGSGNTAVDIQAAFAGATPNTVYHYRAAATNNAGTDKGNDKTFTTLAAPNAPGAFTLSDEAPYWDANPPAGPAVRLNWTASGSAANYDVYRDGSLYASNVTGTTFLNNLGLTGGQTYTYFVVAKNAYGSRQSNSVPVTMPIGPLAALSSLMISGPSGLAPGASANYLATAHYSDATSQDVTAGATWSVSSGPVGTHMSGATLVAGSGTSSSAIVTATYGKDSTTKSSSKSVAIGAGLSVSIGSVSSSYSSGSGNSLTYSLSAVSMANGGNGNLNFSWKLDTTFLAYGASLNTFPTTSPGNHNLTVTVTDGNGLTASAVNTLFLPKSPQPLEQFTQQGAGVRSPATLYAADGVSGFAFPPNHAGRDNGVVVIIHGLNDSVESEWMKSMAGAIQSQLGTGAAPNIILYDWRNDAAPFGKGIDHLMAAAGEAMDIFPPQSGLRGLFNTIIGTSLITGALSGSTFLWVVDLLSVRPDGEAHGFALASYLSEQIGNGNIDASRPIQLIGHSAGGFVAANGGLGLLASRHPSRLQVTTLDTPFLRGSQVLFVKLKGGKVDRYVSSALGELVPGVVALDNLPAIARFLLPGAAPLLGFGNSVTSTELISQDASYHVGADIDTAPEHWWQDGSRVLANHSNAHDWYIKTVNAPDSYGEGFYYSPFLNHAFPGATAQLARSAASSQQATVNLLPLAGFLTFGNVAETSGAYTLSEQGNAGIYQQITIPMNASTLKFNVQFTQAGDGDFIEVSFGNHPVLVNIPDGDAFHNGAVPIEIPIVLLGGEMGQLLFKLNGVGADNAVAVIDSITITTDDDADGDGLSFAQEMALGTDPRYADSDADGLSDAEEVNIHHTNPLLTDSDGDGINDAAEITAGTDPNDNASAFKVKDIARRGDGSVTIRWNAVTGKTYRVVRSATPDFTAVDVLATKVSGIAPLTSYTDPASNLQGVSSAFYRVEIDD